MDGERLAELRDNRGLSQEALGKILHVTQDTISNYERGKTSPDDETKRKIAEYFNVSMDYLLGLSKEEKPLHHTGTTVLVLDNLPQGAKEELALFLEYLRNRYHL